jgi:dual specificity protein kinase YAK1
MKDFISKICSALNFFAQCGIVHADLKPDNILLNIDEETMKIHSLKIIDFGSAFILSQDGRQLKD